MTDLQKRTVIQRLRAADGWLANQGAPLEWVRTLLREAAEELETQTGSLWCQWPVSRQTHVRVFVTGPMGAREIERMQAYLALDREYFSQATVQPPSVDAVDPVATNSHEPPTRASDSSDSSTSPRAPQEPPA